MTQNIKQNYLSPLEFRFAIKRLPYVSFFTQNVTLPGVSSNPADINTPFKSIYFGGDHLTYNQFVVNFRVNENMDNYLEIYNWLLGITFPNNFEEYANLEASDSGIYSDATLLIMSSGKTPNIQYKFKDIFPIDLSDINMDTTAGDIDYVTASVTFQIGSYDIETV